MGPWKIAGFQSILAGDRSDALTEMLQQIQSRILGAEGMSSLSKIDLPCVDFTAAKQMVQPARAAIAKPKIDYAIPVLWQFICTQ